jgi:hypothetical protein
MADSAQRRPVLRSRRVWASGLAAGLVIMFASMGWLWALYEYKTQRLTAVTTLAGQGQAYQANHGLSTFGPPAKSVAAGKDDPPPANIVPTEPAKSNAPGVTFDEQRIVNMVLAKIPKPRDGKTPSGPVLQRAIAAVMEDHPELSKPGIAAAVAAYLTAKPPAPGKAGRDGVNGQNGANGSNGLNGVAGDSVTGAHVCQPATDAGPDLSDYCTTVQASGQPPAVGDLVVQITSAATGEIRYSDAGPAPRGPQGDTGPQGPQGSGPTDQQLADAVAAYMADHPVDACRDGYSPNDERIELGDGSSVVARVCTKDGSEEPSPTPSPEPPPTVMPSGTP